MLKITNKEDNTIVVDIYGDIVNSFIKEVDKVLNVTTVDSIKQKITNDKATLIFNFNSGGGDVFTGTAISNIIKSHKGKTIANIDGICASIASVIALSCDEINMPKNAYLMIHKPSAMTFGTADELRDTAELLDKVQDNIESVYNNKKLDTVSNEDITNYVNDETWFNGEEASKIFKINLKDEIKIANCITDTEFNNLPKNLEKIFNNETQKDNNVQLSADTVEKLNELKILEV